MLLKWLVLTLIVKVQFCSEKYSWDVSFLCFLNCCQVVKLAVCHLLGFFLVFFLSDSLIFKQTLMSGNKIESLGNKDAFLMVNAHFH